MFFKDKYCPTCKNGMQVFRKLEAGERAAAEERHRHRHDLWRCTAEGCQWYQPWAHQSDGGRLPEKLRIPAADTKE